MDRQTRHLERLASNGDPAATIPRTESPERAEMNTERAATRLVIVAP
jgi:hypothetical protein